MTATERDIPEYGFATRQVHAGRVADDGHDPRATPIYLTAGFVFDDFEQATGRFGGTEDGYAYTRVGNPTHTALERRVADLEGGHGALALGSGQAALSTVLFALAGAGEHIVAASSIYEGSRELIRDNFHRLGIESTFIADALDLDAWQRAITPQTRALFAESIPNPKNDLVDIRALAELSHRNGLPLIIDNTLASPYLLRPIEHGADIVVHSASKFLSGHGTVIGGIIVDSGWFDWSLESDRFPQLAAVRGPDGRTWIERAGRGAFIEYARSLAMRFGPVASPLTSFLILQGIETLSLRVQRQSDSALRIAQWLEQHPFVESVDYSGLDSSPYRALAQRYLPKGQGSVFAFTVRGGLEGARAVHDSLALFTRMTHLGDVRSLVLHPGSTTHLSRADDDRSRSGIHPGLLRLSIGVEEVDDLLADLAQALDAAASRAGADLIDEVRGA
jgi:O-acetylhomoserine (thiol)-lyase